jgi:hypothetical protein
MVDERALTSAFAVYRDEMTRCRRAKAYWALLHLAVCIPDICGALEAPDGESTGSRYKDWCDRHLPAAKLNGAERWRLRCKVLHQGRATTDQPGRYTDFTFGQPAATGEVDHYRVVGSTLHTDVGQLADEALDGLDQWIKTVVASPANAVAKNVAKNLPSLVKVTQTPVVTASGVVFTSMKTTR